VCRGLQYGSHNIGVEHQGYVNVLHSADISDAQDPCFLVMSVSTMHDRKHRAGFDALNLLLI
jgi:hypothetical protein